MQEIYKEVAEELSYSEELVRRVGTQVGDSLRNFIAEPTKWQFLINKFAKFEPRYYSIKTFIEKAEKRSDNPQRVLLLIEKYKKIIELGNIYKKQQKENGIRRQKKS
jgi:sulfite reductase alpha subunit-like flavoprotein